MPARMFQTYALAVMLAGVAVLAAQIHLRTGALPLYPGDGAYLSLALAEGLLSGSHGINPGEVALPDGSPLAPVLLAPLLALGLGEWSPLVLGVLGQGVAVWLLAGALGPAVAGRLASALVGAPFLVQAVDGFALPLAGTMAPWLVAASVAVLVGLARAATGPPPGFLLPAILLVPALRPEGAVLSLAAVVALLCLGRWAVALLALAGLGLLGSASAYALQVLGLPLRPPWFPAPLTALPLALMDQVRFALRTPTGLLLGGLACLLALLALVRPNRARNAVIWPALAGILILTPAGTGAAVALALAGYLLQLRRAAVAPLVLLAVFGWSQLANPLRLPEVAQTTHRLPDQLRRFATEVYPAPVAVTLPGRIAFANAQRVLDLSGRSSAEARGLIAERGPVPDTLRALVAGQAAYAMLPDGALADAIPPEWCRLATLTAPVPGRGAVPGQVAETEGRTAGAAFWLIDPAEEAALREALATFAPDLPQGATLTEAACEPRGEPRAQAP